MSDEEKPTQSKDNVEIPKEVPVHEREEREAVDRAFASNDKLQFDNLIAQANARNNNVIDKDRLFSANEKIQYDNAMALANTRNNNAADHANNTAKYAELALANAVNFQAQMNQEYLRDVAQERGHSDDRHHMAVEHNDLRYHHTIENDRYTLDRLYSVFAEEAVSLKTLLATVKKAGEVPKV